MDPLSEESRAIRSKARALIERTIFSLEQIDSAGFPTEASEKARENLLKILHALCDPTTIEPIAPAILLQKIFELQNLVRMLEDSTTTHISWPLVGYCDCIWRKFFPVDERLIFYSLMPEHNYSISRFSKSLREDVLQGILPMSMVGALLQGPELYCLRLASIEDQNLPLYALIGHEFGHAVHDSREEELKPAFLSIFEDIINTIRTTLYAEDAIQTNRRLARTVAVLWSLGTELFSDLVGSLLMGPAFALSLHEMSWGTHRNVFPVLLAPKNEDITAHPSYNFRLSCLQMLSDLPEFCKNAKAHFVKLTDQRLRQIPDMIENIRNDSSSDTIRVHGHAGIDASLDAPLIERALMKCRKEIQGALMEYLTTCKASFHAWYPDSVPQISTQDIADLLLRLQHRVLPNIIPDPNHDGLLGRPADFTSILNAAALYRLQLLTKGGDTDFSELAREVGIIERLTGKALEVSFIQREHLNWRGSRS